LRKKIYIAGQEGMVGKAIYKILCKKYKSSYSVFNLGTGKGSSVLEVIQTFEKVTQVKLNYKIGPRRGGDITQIYAGCEKAEKELGWKTERDLENCMKTAWDWEKKLESLLIS
jgi:UDP-glucose 4-epimerase